MGCSFLRTLQIQGQEKLGVVSTRPENKTGFYIWPMEVGCQRSGLVSSSGLPAFLCIRSSPTHLKTHAACGKQLAGGFCEKLGLIRVRPENE